MEMLWYVSIYMYIYTWFEIGIGVGIGIEKEGTVGRLRWLGEYNE